MKNYEQILTQKIDLMLEKDKSGKDIASFIINLFSVDNRSKLQLDILTLQSVSKPKQEKDTE